MRNLISIVLGSVCLILGSAAWSNEVEQARQALQQQDYQTALTNFRSAAEKGDADAQFNLGLMYDQGLAVAQNHTQAAHWYTLAAKQGHTNAQVALGFMYQSGQGVTQDPQAAFEWLVRATEGSLAQSPLVIRASKEPSAVDQTDAFERVKALALQGEPESLLMLGDMYFHAMGVPRDQAAAYQWYLLAAQQGVTRAQLNVGAMYASGDGVQKDPQQALAWFQKALPGQVAPTRAQVDRSACSPGRHAVLPEIMGLSYHQARAQLIAAGWAPLRGDLVDVPHPPGNASYFLKVRGYSEVESCSATGLAWCRFLFQDMYGNKLLIGSVGEEVPGIQTAEVNRVEFLCDEQPQWRAHLAQGNLEYSIVKGEGSVWIDCPTPDGSPTSHSQIGVKFRDRTVDRFEIIVNNIRYRSPIEANDRLGDDNFLSLLDGIKKSEMSVRFADQAIIFPRNNVDILPARDETGFACNLSTDVSEAAVSGALEAAHTMRAQIKAAMQSSAVPNEQQGSEPTPSGGGYAESIRRCIESGVDYTPEARSGMVNPLVRYRVQLNERGQPVSVQLRATSGNATFDRAVNSGILRCTPFPRPPNQMYPSYIDIGYRMYEDTVAGSPTTSAPVVPPSDARPLSTNKPPRYPVQAYQERMQGTAIVDVLVLSNGRAGSVTVVESSGYAILDNAAVATVKDWRFEPATQNGKAVDQRVKLPVTFRLAQRQVPAPIPIEPQEYGSCSDVGQCVANMLLASFPLDLGSLDRYADNVGVFQFYERADRAKARELNKTGLQAFNAGDYRSAAAAFRRASDADSGDVEIMANLGYAFVKGGQLDSAALPLGAALTLAPRRTSTWIPVAEYFSAVGEFEKAVRSLLVAYQYSGNRSRTIRYYGEMTQTAAPTELRRVYQAALDIVSSQIYGFDKP